MTKVTQNTGLAVKGHYTIRKISAETGEVLQELGPFSNKITDSGLNRLGTGNAYSHCFVGTGTNPAEFTDTTMGTYLAETTSYEDALTAPVAPTWFAQVARTYKFAAGVAQGNLTEVGVGWKVTNDRFIFSRELIVDSAGNPVTITILSNEILEVVYTLRYYIDTTDSTGSFVLNGITYNYTTRIQEASIIAFFLGNPLLAPGISGTFGPNMSLGSFTGTPTGTAGTTGAISSLAYVPGSNSREAITSFSLTQGNITGGIKGWTARTSAAATSGVRIYYQTLLDKAIPKTALNTMSITLKISWSRYTGVII